MSSSRTVGHERSGIAGADRAVRAASEHVETSDLLGVLRVLGCIGARERHEHDAVRDDRLQSVERFGAATIETEAMHARLDLEPEARALCTQECRAAARSS